MFPVKDERAPKLRFADFEGEWEQCKLEDYATYRRGSFPQPYGNKNGMMEKCYAFCTSY